MDNAKTSTGAALTRRHEGRINGASKALEKIGMPRKSVSISLHANQIKLLTGNQINKAIHSHQVNTKLDAEE